MTDITNVSAVNAQQAKPATGQLSNQQFGTDMFLQLLVTQLRYQDPMSGSQDTGELVTQLAMFTLLEQVVKLQQTVEAQSLAMGNQQALGLLNKHVELLGSEGEIITGNVDSVEFRSAGPLITVKGQDYQLSSIIRVEEGQHGS